MDKKWMGRDEPWQGNAMQTTLSRIALHSVILFAKLMAIRRFLRNNLLPANCFTFSPKALNGEHTTDTQDSISNSESGDLDHDSDTMDSEKALNLAMDEESLEGQALCQMPQLQLKNGPALAPNKNSSFTASIPNEGAYGAPPNASVPTTGGSTLSSNSMVNSAAAALAGGAGTLPLNQLAQVNISYDD